MSQERGGLIDEKFDLTTLLESLPRSDHVHQTTNTRRGSVNIRAMWETELEHLFRVT
ncbi:hypothetical protein Bpfe_022968, partial [Biomphalaria pfeifferi]